MVSRPAHFARSVTLIATTSVLSLPAACGQAEVEGGGLGQGGGQSGGNANGGSSTIGGSGGMPAAGRAGSVSGAAGATSSAGASAAGESATGGASANGGFPSGGAPAPGGAPSGGTNPEGGSNQGGDNQGGAATAGAGGEPGEAGAPGAAGNADGCNGLLLCEDFESYAEGETPTGGLWSKQGGGSATIDTERFVSGDKSVHIVTGESEGGRVWLHTTTDDVFPTRHFFGRMRMYLTTVPETEVHWDMIEAQGVADAPEVWDEPFEVAMRYGGQLDEQLLANFETPGSYGDPPQGPRTDCAKFSETPMPDGRWVCMEWEFDSDESVMRFWLDEEAVEDMEVHTRGTQCIEDGTDGDWYYPTFESLNIGWREWWEAGSRELGSTTLHCRTIELAATEPTTVLAGVEPDGLRKQAQSSSSGAGDFARGAVFGGSA